MYVKNQNFAIYLILAVVVGFGFLLLGFLLLVFLPGAADEYDQ